MSVATPPAVRHFQKEDADYSRPAHCRTELAHSFANNISLRPAPMSSGAGSDDPLPVFSNCALSGTEHSTARFSKGEYDWSPKAERRFHELAIKFVKKKLSPSETAEYQSLKVLRRSKAGALAGEELFRQNRDRQMLVRIKQTIEQYVEFHRFKSDKKI